MNLFIGQFIRQLREHQGLSQEDLALRARLSRGYLSKLEHEQCEPSPAVLQKLSQALQTPLADLYRVAGLHHLLTGLDAGRDPALELYLHQIDHLPEPDRDIIVGVLQRILAEEQEYAAQAGGTSDDAPEPV